MKQRNFSEANSRNLPKRESIILFIFFVFLEEAENLKKFSCSRIRRKKSVASFPLRIKVGNSELWWWWKFRNKIVHLKFQSISFPGILVDKTIIGWNKLRLWKQARIWNISIEPGSSHGLVVVRLIVLSFGLSKKVLDGQSLVCLYGKPSFFRDMPKFILTLFAIWRFQ